MHALGKQQARVRAWDEAVAEFTPEGLGSIEADALAEIEEQAVQVVPTPPTKEDDWEATAEDWTSLSQDYLQRAISEL